MRKQYVCECGVVREEQTFITHTKVECCHAQRPAHSLAVSLGQHVLGSFYHVKVAPESVRATRRPYECSQEHQCKQCCKVRSCRRSESAAKALSRASAQERIDSLQGALKSQSVCADAL